MLTYRVIVLDMVVVESEANETVETRRTSGRHRVVGSRRLSFN